MAQTKINREGPANVYVVKSDLTTAVYYGSTQNDIDTRWEDHFASLKHDRHFNSKLQYLWNVGIRDWKIELLEVVSSREAGKEMEKDLICNDSNAVNVIYRHAQRRNNTITEDAIRQVKELKQSGMKQIYIAKMTNFSGCTISKIVNGMYDHKLEEVTA